MQLLRKRYGAAVRGEVLESAVQDSSAEAIRERNLRPALPPRYELVSSSRGGRPRIQDVARGLPDMPEPDFAALGLEKLVVEVPDEDVDKALERMAEQQRKSEPVERPAESGDIVVADIVGHMSATRRSPAAAARTAQIELGAEGLAARLQRAADSAPRPANSATVRVTFPAGLRRPGDGRQGGGVRGTVKEVRHRLPAAIDDALAEAVGLESLAELRQEIRQRMQRDYDGHRAPAAEARAARQAGRATTISPVPPGMVEMEFDVDLGAIRGGARSPPTDRRAGCREPERGRQPRRGAGRCGRSTRQCHRAGGNRAGGCLGRAPATAEAAKPAEHETDAAGHHAIPHPGSSSEPVDAAAIIAPEETALEGASDTRTGAASRGREDDEKNREEYRRIAERRVRWGCCLPRSVATTILQSARTS